MTIEEKNRLFGFDEECPNDIPAEEMMVKPFVPKKNKDFWIDPAGGKHYEDEEDPAKMYE